MGITRKKEKGNFMERIQDVKILIVDDNEELLEMLEKILKKEGFLNLFLAKSCKEAREVYESTKPDFMILDVNLPDGNGFHLFVEFRQKDDIPALFLSARDEDQDRLFGLGLGADDYITKPFLTQELLLRIQLILKRTYANVLQQKKTEDALKIGNASIDFKSATVKKDGAESVLTAKELAILKKLVENRGNIVTFDMLCEAVWGDGYYGYENTLMVHIRHLREKIEENPSKPEWILTVRGLGYRLVKEA